MGVPLSYPHDEGDFISIHPFGASGKVSNDIDDYNIGQTKRPTLLGCRVHPKVIQRLKKMQYAYFLLLQFTLTSSTIRGTARFRRLLLSTNACTTLSTVTRRMPTPSPPGRRQVVVIRCDVTVADDVTAALFKAGLAGAGLPPVRGIVHAACPPQGGGADKEDDAAATTATEVAEKRFMEAKVSGREEGERRQAVVTGVFPSPPLYAHF